MEENIPVQQLTLTQENPVKVVIENQPVSVTIKENRPVKITLGLVLGWVLGIYAFLWGFINVFIYPTLGCLSLVSGIIVFPPISNILRAKLNIDLSGSLKWFIYLILQVIGGFLLIGEMVKGLIH